MPSALVSARCLLPFSFASLWSPALPDQDLYQSTERIDVSPWLTWVLIYVLRVSVGVLCHATARCLAVP